MTQRAGVGDWVQVEDIVLEAGQRAPQVPEDTAHVPLVMRVKGFAQEEAAVGETITIETIIGRTVRGRLVDLEPAYEHDFGKPIRELLTIGPEARAVIAEYESGMPSGGDTQ